jgi:hypothetical protein
MVWPIACRRLEGCPNINVSEPTAHRQNGRLSRARKTPGTKTQRQLNVHDLAAAIASTVKQGSAGRRRNS